MEFLVASISDASCGHDLELRKKDVFRLMADGAMMCHDSLFVSVAIAQREHLQGCCNSSLVQKVLGFASVLGKNPSELQACQASQEVFDGCWLACWLVVEGLVQVPDANPVFLRAQLQAPVLFKSISFETLSLGGAQVSESLCGSGLV